MKATTIQIVIYLVRRRNTSKSGWFAKLNLHTILYSHMHIRRSACALSEICIRNMSECECVRCALSKTCIRNMSELCMSAMRKMSEICMRMT